MTLAGFVHVGHYDFRREQWHIRQPFRLFVDEQTLRPAVSLASREAQR